VCIDFSSSEPTTLGVECALVAHETREHGTRHFPRAELSDGLVL